MAPIQRTMARALVEAGYMPLHEYIRLFADEATQPAIAEKPFALGARRTRFWSVPAHFVSPIRQAVYRVRLQKKRARG